MQIRLYNSSNNNHIALRFAEVTSRQLVMPFMLSKPVTQLRMQIVQKIGSTETILAQEYYRHTGFRLTNMVLEGSTLKVYANGSILRAVTVTPMTVNRLELTGGAKKLLVDEMFVAPHAATEDDIETWYNLEQQFLDENEIIAHEGAGANLLIDKSGIRAIRKADGKKTFEIDTETGDAYFRGDISGASGTFGNGSIHIGADGLRAEKNGNTTFEIDSDGNAYFSGEISAASILSNSLLLSALTDFSWVTASNEVFAGSSWSTMPGMTLQVTVDSPTVLFIIANSGAVGASYYEYYDTFGTLWNGWANAEVRLRVNGNVRVTSHSAPYVSPMFHIESVNPGTHTIQMEWRWRWGGNLAGFNVSASYRGIYVLKLRR